MTNYGKVKVKRAHADMAEIPDDCGYTKIQV